MPGQLRVIKINKARNKQVQAELSGSLPFSEQRNRPGKSGLTVSPAHIGCAQ